MKEITWIILVTDDYYKSKKFYKDRLGLIVEREIAEDEFVQFKLKHCTLALFGRKHAEKVVGKKVLGNPGGAIYTWDETNNVDNLYTELKAKGVHFIKPPKTQVWGQRTAYFTDPDGHIWEIQKWL